MNKERLQEQVVERHRVNSEREVKTILVGNYESMLLQESIE